MIDQRLTWTKGNDRKNGDKLRLYCCAIEPSSCPVGVAELATDRTGEVMSFKLSLLASPLLAASDVCVFPLRLPVLRSLSQLLQLIAH